MAGDGRTRKESMKALVVVDGGICGFKTRIHAESDDSQNVAFRIVSGCEKVRKFGEALTAKGPVDGYAEIGAGADGVVLTTSRESLKGCCAGCAVHAGTFKAMQVAAGVALPKDVILKIAAE
jgi:hypothetical protein